MKNNTVFFIKDNLISNQLIESMGAQVIKHSDIFNLFTVSELDDDSSFLETNTINYNLFELILSKVLVNKLTVGGNIFVIGNNLNKKLLYIWKTLTQKHHMNYTVVSDKTHDQTKQVLFKSYAQEIMDIDDFKKFINKNSDDFMIDVSSYKMIYFFGDLQGCYDPVKTFFEKNGIQENELYVFLGDYIDRGIENDLTMNFIKDTINLDNFIYLKGNHDEYLKNYGLYQEYISPPVFVNDTLPQLINKLSRYDAWRIYNKLEDIVTLKYHDSKILLTHAGLATVPDRPQLLTRKMCIKGYGKYNTEVDRIFSENEKNWIQIHGHRNIKYIDIKKYNNSFNLEGQVEFGKYLRGIKLYQENGKTIFDPVLIQNKVYKVGLLKTKEPSFEIVKNRRDDWDIQNEDFYREGDNIIFSISKNKPLDLNNLNITGNKLFSFPVQIYNQDFDNLCFIYYSKIDNELKYIKNGQVSETMKNVFNKQIDDVELNRFKRYAATFDVNFTLNFDSKENKYSIVSVRTNGLYKGIVIQKGFEKFCQLFTNIEYIKPNIVLNGSLELIQFFNKDLENNTVSYFIIDANHHLLQVNYEKEKRDDFLTQNHNN